MGTSEKPTQGSLKLLTGGQEAGGGSQPARPGRTSGGARDVTGRGRAVTPPGRQREPACGDCHGSVALASLLQRPSGPPWTSGKIPPEGRALVVVEAEDLPSASRRPGTATAVSSPIPEARELGSPCLRARSGRRAHGGTSSPVRCRSVLFVPSAIG